jgi:hypothetical protein
MDGNGWHRLVLTLFPIESKYKRDNVAVLAIDGEPVARVIFVGRSKRQGGKGIVVAIEAPESVQIWREGATPTDKS